VSELEFVGLVLEDQLLDHLATPEGAMAIWKERLDPEVIPETDAGIREALKFVTNYIDQYREPPSVGIIADETGYSEFAAPEAPVSYVIERLRDRYRRTQLKQVTTKIARLSKDSEAALNYGLDELSKIKVRTTEVAGSITEKDFRGTMDDYVLAQQDIENGITTGYELIDSHIGGLRTGEITVILARPKRYKSWQLIKSLVGAFEEGRNVSIATMEMSEKVMRNRIHCMFAGVNYARFEHKILNDDELADMERVAEQLEEEGENRLLLFRPKIGERNVANLANQAGEHEAEVLFIDQLSWFDGAKDEGNWRIIGQIMEQLKDASMHFPIFMAAQYNRVQAKEEGIGDLANIGLADAVGQTADMLLGIYANKDMLTNRLLHLGIVDSRSFEPISWEIKVELTEHSNFKALNVLSDG
jgi:replicative DNA helicase